VDSALGTVYLAAVVVALVAAGLELGMRQSAREVLAPLRRVGLLTRVAVVDVLVLPLVVWALIHLFRVPSGYSTGLLLVGIASAGPLGIKASQLAGADAATALSLVVVLELANVAAIPLMVALLLPEGTEVQVARSLAAALALVLLPIILGLCSRRWLPERSARLLPVLPKVANVALGVAVASTVVRDGDALVSAIGERVPLVAAVSVCVALTLGWLAGGPGRATRAAAALVTGIRANALALAIAAASFPGRADVRAGVVVFALFSIIVPLCAALAIGRRFAREGALARG
jgi:bile acid:Na+ symporter, BASS family